MFITLTQKDTFSHRFKISMSDKQNKTTKKNLLKNCSPRNQYLSPVKGCFG